MIKNGSNFLSPFRLQLIERSALFAALIIISPGVNAQDYACQSEFAALSPEPHGIEPPYIRLQTTPVHIDPEYKWIAVVFEFEKPEGQQADIEITNIESAVSRADLPLKPLKAQSPSFRNFEDSVLLFEITDSDPFKNRENISNALRGVLNKLKRPARIGLPINRKGQWFAVLDNHFVVRFNQSSSPMSFNNWLKNKDAVPITELGKGDHLWHIRFNSNNYCKNLAVIETALADKIFTIATADLLLPLSDHHDLVKDDKVWPNDTRYWQKQYSSEGMHTNLHVREAWHLIHMHAGDGTVIDIGSNKINIASLDRGIDTSNPEMKDKNFCKNRQIFCLDPTRNNGSCANQILEKHGRAVFGVISACGNNNKNEISGIAPGANHYAVIRPSYTAIKSYAEVLLWTAGMDPDCWSSTNPDPDVLCPPHNSIPAMDVINASHSFTWDPVQPPPPLPHELPPAIDSAFERITKGRGGKGTVLVYSAANDNRSVETYEPFARDSRTVGVANCYWDGGTKTFKPYTGIQASNYGASLDVCAIGEGSETVLAACTSGATNCAFGGTSSAAAAVSGTVALMLTAKYCLSSDQLRMVLAASTDPYDFTTPHGREYGTGVLNAFQAVTGAINTACP